MWHHAETTPATAESASAQPSDSNLSRGERALTQTLSAEQPVASGRTEISAGHVDMGPRFNNGKFELMLHDDHGETPVWRSLDEVIYRGSDQAILEVPNDPRYSFVGAPAGSKVYVIPQTETKGVIWPGWNTQDPQLVSKLNRGVNLTLEQVSGPGTFSLYLENGNFSAPQVLWSSTKSEPQKLWVEKNTHTHANWVFTAPGEYLLKVTASAELSDGSTVTDTRYLKFAVGDSASADTPVRDGGAGPRFLGFCFFCFLRCFVYLCFSGIRYPGIRFFFCRRSERPERLQGRVHCPLGCYCRRRGSCDCRGRVPFVPSPLLRAA